MYKKLSRVQAYGVVSCSNFPLLVLGRKQIGAILTPSPAAIFLSLDFGYFCDIGGPYLNMVQYYATSISVLIITDTLIELPFVESKPLGDIYLLLLHNCQEHP